MNKAAAKYFSVCFIIMSLGFRLFFIYYSSVLNGEAGNPSLLHRLGNGGLSAHAYRTYMGLATSSLHTTTLCPSIFALAQTNFLSGPAIANSFNSSPLLVINPLPVLVNEMTILFPSTVAA